MTDRMTSTKLASDFYARGLANRWLTAKQFGFLWSLAEREGFAQGREAIGVIVDGEGNPIASWAIARMPGGAAIFQVREVSAPVAETDEEREIREEAAAIRAEREARRAARTAA